MRKITVWSIIKTNGETTHNHIENGWIEGEYPQPIKKEFNNQLAWQKMKWKREYGYLSEDYKIRK